MDAVRAQAYTTACVPGSLELHNLIKGGYGSISAYFVTKR